MSYKINENYFDIINSEDKAYWLGFWWCDGYVSKRKRYLEKYNKSRIEYNIKFSLALQDKDHLEKFKLYSESTHPIKIYKSSIAFKANNENDYFESRLFITNTHMGTILQDKYGLIPHRYDCSKVIRNIPKELERHFIRGVLDSDGSFSWYFTIDKKYDVIKCNVQFTTYLMLIEYIEQHLYNNKIILNNNHVKECRHEGKDEYCRTLHLSGRVQALDVLYYLYNKSTVYLNRKYKKYKNMLKECA